MVEAKFDHFFGKIFMERLETPLVTCHAIVWRVWSHQGIKTVGPKTLIWEGRGPRPFLVAPMFEAKVWAVVRIGVTIFSQWETRMGDISPIGQRDNAALFSILGRKMGRGWQVMAQLETNYILIPNTSNSLWHLICQFVSHSYLCILLRVSWSVWFYLKKQHFLCSVDNFSLLLSLKYSDYYIYTFHLSGGYGSVDPAAWECLCNATCMKADDMMTIHILQM